MRRLYFGGSFNPIHHGHLVCARAVAERAGFQRVVLIPSAQPPHKPDATDLAAPEHRLAMCQLAAMSQPDLFEVDDLELRRAGRSFTIDTVRDLRERGCGEIHWLIGADMVEILPMWHRAEELVREVEFVVMARPGWSFGWEGLPEAFRGLRANVVEAPLMEISGSEIRKRVREGKSIEFLTPGKVIEYVRGEGLYR